MANLPNRIRELRLARDWSQDRLAEAVQCSKVQISDLERGNVSLTIAWMQRIASALGVTPGELLLPEQNPYQLAEDERRLLDRYRQASPEQRDNIERVTEALSGWKPPPRKTEAA